MNTPKMWLIRKPLDSAIAADSAFLLLNERAHTQKIAPPAALFGEWFASRAVLAPTVQLTEFGAEQAFLVPTQQPQVPNAIPGAVGGGWFGYLSYDLIDPSGRKGSLPRSAWGWADHVLRLDHSGQWWFEALISDDEADFNDLAAEYEELLARTPPHPTWQASTLTHPLPTEHHAAVKSCMHAIEAGELFQANICTRFTGDFIGEPAALFSEGVRSMSPRRAAYLAGEWGALASFSPELFISRQGNRAHSTPIKGTLPRRGPADDDLARQLRESVKDVAENVMIIDLVRNDLGRVCEVGSVRVPELLKVRAAPGVWHLESTVEGHLIKVDDAELLRATFPPGSVTGAPKLRALDLIAELETTPRGVYTGAMGLVSPIAGLELNVAIRTFELYGDQIAGCRWRNHYRFGQRIRVARVPS